MLVTGKIIPWLAHDRMDVRHVAILGVLLAFPLKRRFVNDEQLPFPEGRASGVVLDALYTGAAGRGHVQGEAACLHRSLHRSLPGHHQRRLDEPAAIQGPAAWTKWAGMKEPWTFHERIDSYYYAMRSGRRAQYIPTILGTDLRVLGLRLTLDAAMLGIGGLMGIVVATSCLLGALDQFRDPCADHDPGRRHRRPRRSQRRGGADFARRDREPVVTVVGRDHDGRRLAGKSRWVGPRSSRASSSAVRRAMDADVLKHIEFPLWISARGYPDLQRPRGDWVTPRVLRRALAAGIRSRCRSSSCWRSSAPTRWRSLRGRPPARCPR